MAKEDWTDDRLDEVIDAAARRMTEGAPRPGLPARVTSRNERHGPQFVPAWQLASAVGVLVVAVAFLLQLWPTAPRERAASPILPHISQQAAPPPSGSVIAQNRTAPSRPVEKRTRRGATIVSERPSDDIPALEAPPGLSVDAPPVAQLRVAPLDVRELSVPPLETEPDGKPR